MLKPSPWITCPGSGLTPTKFDGDQKIVESGRIKYQRGMCDVCGKWKAVNANSRRTLRKHKKMVGR